MQAPRFFEPCQVATDTWSLPSWMPVPGIGVLPCNAYAIRAREPTLVDTGLGALRNDVISALSNLIDPADLRWIWITHVDPDHVGNLNFLLQRAPRARVVTTYLGMGKMGLLGLPLDRVRLLNPGQALDVGDRRLVAVVPPSFDAPETTGLFDTRSHAFFSADSFGAVQQTVVETANEIEPDDLRDGMRLWTSVDAPWFGALDAGRLGATLARVRALHAAVVLGSHLQPARNLTETLLRCLADAAEAAPFVGPDQQALEAMLASQTAAVA